jgi:hypothetical protein
MLYGRIKTRRFSAYLSHFSKIIFEKWLFRQFQRLASPAKAGFGGKELKGQKSQWCESHPKAGERCLVLGWKIIL